MKDILGHLKDLRRPRLLIRAARIGAQDYRRGGHLQRLLGYGPAPRTGAALMRLIEIEEMQNAQRRNGDGGYSVTRHVDVLIAMMGEARLLQGPSRGGEI